MLALLLAAVQPLAPVGLLVSSARTQTADAVEDEAFARVKKKPSIAEIRDFLRRYPFGQRKDEAEAILEEIRENLAWDTAQEEDTQDSYEAYLTLYPGGRFAREAKRRAAAKGTSRKAFIINAETALQGQSRSQASVASPNQCKEACGRDPTCQGYDFAYGTQACKLYNQVDGGLRREGYTAGTLAAAAVREPEPPRQEPEVRELEPMPEGPIMPEEPPPDLVELRGTGLLGEKTWTACVANVPPGDVLNVRERPTTRSPIVGFFHRDDCNIRIKCEGNWCYTASHELSGYVSRAYLRRQGGMGGCGWYVALGCSQSPSGARSILSNLGGAGAGAGAYVVDNADLPNFTPGWWCVVDGPYGSRARADRSMWNWTDAVPDAYVKSGC